MTKKKKCKCGSDYDIDKKSVTMSIPDGLEFGKSYTMDKTIRSDFYYDFNRNTNGQSHMPFNESLDIEIMKITDLLKSKNKAYGNTALNPTNIFSKLNATEAICARIDDKLARIKNKGIKDETEDTVDDLIGYLLLLKMSM
jgi:hypothetical protein